MKWLTWFSIATLAGMAWAASASDILPKDMRAEDVYWSDADSGRLNGEKFRLANVDAPEKGGVGSIGGAKCEVERERAFDAKRLHRHADSGCGCAHRPQLWAGQIWPHGCGSGSERPEPC